MVKNIDGGLIKTLSLFGETGKSQVPIIMISNFISYHRPIDLVEGRGYQSRKYAVRKLWSDVGSLTLMRREPLDEVVNSLSAVRSFEEGPTTGIATSESSLALLD